jgi:hypothetical protein
MTTDNAHLTITPTLITPQEAETMFSNRCANRKFQPTVGERYRAAMDRNEWVANASILFLDENNNLVEGQHRVWAVWKSGKAQWFLVRRNAPASITGVVDTGFKRNLGHSLAIAGEKNIATLAMAIRMVWIYRRRPELLATSYAERELGFPTHGELIRFLNENEPDIREAASKSTALRLRGYSDGLRATLLHLFAEVTDWETAISFFAQLQNGEGLRGTDPIFQLRKAVIEQRPHRGIALRMMAALTIKAWNYWIQGENLKFLRWRAQGPGRESFTAIVGG